MPVSTLLRSSTDLLSSLTDYLSKYGDELPPVTIHKALQCGDALRDIILTEIKDFIDEKDFENLKK